MGAALASALLLALLATWSACDQQGAGNARPTATAAAQTPLTSFADWRAAYLSGDLRLHAASTDGKGDVAVAIAPGLTGPGSQNLGVSSGGFAPDGRLVSYEGADGLHVSDVTGDVAPKHIARALAYFQAWSPDSKLLVYFDGPGAVTAMRLTDGQLTPVPSSPSLDVIRILGWADNAHLVVIASPPYKRPTAAPHTTPTEVSSGGPPPGPTSVTLYTLDIASGALRPFVTLTSSTMGIASFSLSPDGQTVLYFNRPFRDYPYAPDPSLIDVKSGVVTHLPRIASATGAWYTGVAWLPGTHTIAVSTGFYLTQVFKTWLLDTARDTATPLAATRGAAAGWVPGTQTLILTTGTPDSTAIGQGPYTISAVPDAVANPQAAPVTLATGAYTFPFLGFVRTA